METRFIKCTGRHNVFAVECPSCQSEFEVGIPVNSTALVAHDHCRCVFFKQNLPTGKRFNETPTLEVIFIQPDTGRA